MSMLTQNTKVKCRVTNKGQSLKFFVLPETYVSDFVSKAQGLLHMCCIGKSFNEMVHPFVDNIIYEHSESVYLVSHESF